METLSGAGKPGRLPLEGTTGESDAIVTHLVARAVLA